MIGAVIVGIGAYRAGAGTTLPPLKYAPADADEVERYLTTCWPRPGDLRVARVPEAGATADAIRQAFDSLAALGRLELCFVFLSGHGLVDESNAGFMVQPNGQGLALFDATALDSCIGSVRAERSILILDCCFAEGIVRKMHYFSALGDSAARLYIASSRERQLTWEDDEIGHGVFTAHLLDLLKTGNAVQLGGRKDRLDVDSELFPVLCEQVPLYVLDHKGGAHQEPVKGGVSISAVSLPVSSLARGLRERTPLGTALRRLRQLATGLAVAGVAMILVAYTLLYYVEPGQSGTFIVLHGTRWLQPVLKLLPLNRVDTGIDIAEISANAAAAAPLQSGYTTGIWTHVASEGYRGWFDAVAAGLEPAAAARYAALVGIPVPPLGEDPGPAAVEQSAWMALADSQSDAPSDVLKHIPGQDRISPQPTPFPINSMDFQILDLTAESMQSYARALGYGADLDPIAAFPAYVGFSKVTQEWLTYNTDAQRGRDARVRVRDSVADVLGIITRARTDRGLAPLEPQDRLLIQGLADMGYGDVLGLALSRVDLDSADRIALGTKALGQFHGEPDDPAQGAAFQTIVASLDASPQAKQLVDAVADIFAKSANPQNSYFTHFLILAADARALSPQLVDTLLVAARQSVAKSEFDFEDSELARVLAHAMSHVPEADRQVAFALIERAAANVTEMSMSTAEMFAALGSLRLDPPGTLEKVEAQAFKAEPYTGGSGSSTQAFPGIAIIVGPGPWIVALAQIGRTRELPARDIAFLRHHVVDPALRADIVPALMHQAESIAPAATTETLINRLGSFPRDARDRSVEQAVGVGQLAAMPRLDFVRALDSLRLARSNAAEPELRIVLGLTLVEAQIARGEPTQRTVAYAQ
ncbi:hypothetical protein X735_31240 [Mesorhizobium sp. L2C085B000]|uniref:caspase family protein n=1 Tax=Mesorhizobium sp. L2C085B000 TaxID=1287117 RepID=UPI0003CFC665|nr:caspase family protein [Mesorhizobium sp. L2C085B000]ESZ06295.1 hypothetical protein X735_31240 [Mesorhizobium sp. L2C085B000]